MSLMKCVIAIVILVSIAIVRARSSLSTRNDAAPKGCKWQRINDATSIELRGDHSIKHLLACKLRTLSGIDSLIGNLSVYQTDRISSLRLECSDVLFFESSLEAAQHAGAFLGSLRNLRELNIDYCKIRNVPSMVLKELRDLHTLSLRTHNSDWNVMSMELHPESFRGLTELKELDLADNNIWSVPTEVFCPLFSLRKLNLTINHLTDIAQLGFSDWKVSPSSLGKACNTGLETLDLSHNHIQKVPDNGLSALISLTTLLLQDNQLTAVVDHAFSGLKSLSVLNMSSNRLIALPPELFQSSRALTQLYLHNNTLSVLAPGLLEGLESLEILDISQNRLGSTWINRNTFNGLLRLTVLNLGHNDLVKIDQNVFHGLRNLQILNLEHNAIEIIANGAFADLKSLHALTLSNNRLKSIDAFHLSELYVLNQLFLEGNLITNIDTRAFENLTNLNDLSLNDNLLTHIPASVKKLRFLKSLDFGKNRIESIADNSFDGLDQLLGLRLVDNMIVNITRDTFSALSSVHVINLASNHIKHIDQSAFNANPTLRAIRLDNNQLEDISGVFTSIPNLAVLNVSDNQLRWFDYSHLPPTLEWLDMHRNNISELGNYFDVRNQLQIKMLDVSHNRLTRIDDSSLPDSLETLFVNNNNLNEVAAGTFLKKRNIEKVVLYGNDIRTLDIGAFALQPVAENRDMPTFYIGDNPIHCDCHMEWLQRINELSHLRQHPRVLDLDMVMCSMEHERGEVIRPLMDLQSQDFLCKYESHCVPLCHCCDFDACDCKMTCPDRCSCYHDHTWNTNVVDCGQADYTEMPERIPMEATAIYLDGNNLGTLNGHMFIGKKRLETLFMNNSRVVSVHNKTFNGVPSLKRLHLEDNLLTELRDDEFDQLAHLTELYLDHNAIIRVGENTFSRLKSLEVLKLSDNKIEDFEPWQQLSGAVDSGSLMHISMTGVKWRCDCSRLNRLDHWIRNLNGGEFDVQQMICSDDRIVGDVLRTCAKTSVKVVAPKLDMDHRSDQKVSSELVGEDYVPILAAAIVLGISVILLLAISCLFRHQIRLWLHSRYGIRLFKDPTTVITNAEDNEKLYDAYLVYSIRDENYATQVIAPELHGYNMCLHHRDLPATTYLNDSLQSAADASKKLIIVVSMNFLQHEWSQPQFRLALQKVIENIAPVNRSRKLVLILTAPLEIITIDPIMQILMQTCPVVHWGEKRFWDKLRFALPDLAQRGGTKKVSNVTCNPGLRYTPAPINLDAWSKSRPGVAIPMTERHPGGVGQGEDENSSCASSQHYAVGPVHNYMCRSSASSLGHVYSTIPETPNGGDAQDGRAFFV